jgi:hypothetical protein
VTKSSAPKWWLKSRTVLVNLLAALLPLAALAVDTLQAHSDLLQAAFTPRQALVAFVVLALANVLLRSVTNGPVSLHKPEQT